MKQQLLELIEEKAKSISNTPYHNKAFLSGAEYALTSPDILEAAGLVKEEDNGQGEYNELWMKIIERIEKDNIGCEMYSDTVKWLQENFIIIPKIKQ